MGILNLLMGIILVIAGFVLLVTIFFKQEIESCKEKDPAAKGFIEIVLLYPGLHAIIAYRMAHYLLNKKIPFIPDLISKVARFITGIEIHPGAQIGRGFFVDHGMGVVIGETSVVGENVTLFQGVTLGGTGKEIGKRHPTLGDNIVVGAGAKILGNITIGSNSYVGANAVVLKSVPENTTVVGVPGQITKQDGKKIDKMMDHIHVLDPVMLKIGEMQEQIDSLAERLKDKDGGK